jgi:hypothetical protein
VNKFLTLAALSGAIAVSACATTSADGGSGGPGVRLQSNDQYTVNVKDVQTATFFGQSTKTDIETTMGLNVLRGGGDQLWRWTYADFKINALELGEDLPPEFDISMISSLFGPAVRLGFSYGFECKVDRDGSCAELTNWSTWRGAIEDTIMLVEAGVKIGTSMNAPASEPALDLDGDGTPDIVPVTPLEPFGGPGDFDQRTMDLIVNIALNLLDGFDGKSAGALATSGFIGLPSVQGAVLTPGGPMDYTRAVPLPYGGGALTFTGTRTVESVDRAAGTALVTTETQIDSKAAIASFLSIFDNLVNPNVQAFAAFDPEGGVGGVMVAAMVRAQMEAALAGATLDFKESTRGVVDLKTGVAREAVTTYTLSIKGGGEFDWVSGEISGTQTVTLTPGAPTIARLTRREIAPPPPKPEAVPPAIEAPEAAPTPPPPPRKKGGNRSRTRR